MSLSLHGLVGAQAVPDAGSLMREEKRETTSPPPSSVRLLPPSPAAAAPSEGPRFTVKAFRLQGATLVPEADLQAALAPWLDRPVDFADLQRAEQAVADVYRSRGWLARPQLPAQDLVGGLVTMTIVESRLGRIRIDDDGQALRFDRGRLEQALGARQKPGEPLRPDELERAVNLLNDLPGLRTAAVLAPGRAPGETDVVLKPVDQPRWAGRASLDDASPRATGATRLAVDLALDSPGRIGDQARMSASTTGAGNVFGSVGYSLPLGADGLRGAVDASAMSYRLGHEFTQAGAHGHSRTLGGSLAYPLVRAGARNVSLRMAVEMDDYWNAASGKTVSDKRVAGVTVGLAGDAVDELGGGSSTSWGVAANGGNVDLSRNAGNQGADRRGPRSAGDFVRLDWNLGRLQGLGRAGALWLAASGQAADRNLDSSGKFSLGGVNGVRAYPALEGTGDNGWLASVEWRYGPRPDLQWIAFYDCGQVKVDQDDRYEGASKKQHVALQGAGVGLNWALADHYGLSAQVARRIGSNPLADPNTGKDTDGSFRRTRLWLSVHASF